MEDQIIEAEGEYFQVKFEKCKGYKMQWTGKVYVLVHDELNLFYCDDSSDMTEDITKARLWLEFSYCWRGVWEGRVYFRQEEFWGGDMSVIAELWTKIEAIMRDQIKKDNPDYGHFD